MQRPCCEPPQKGQSVTAEPAGTDLCSVAGCGRHRVSQQQCILLVHKRQKSPLQQLSKKAVIMCRAHCQGWAQMAQMPLPETGSSMLHRDLHQQKMHQADKWPQVTSLLCLPMLRGHSHRGQTEPSSINQEQRTEPRLACAEWLPPLCYWKQNKNPT